MTAAADEIEGVISSGAYGRAATCRSGRAWVVGGYGFPVSRAYNAIRPLPDSNG